MSSSRPYLLRALYDWVLANNCTPYISVNAFFSEVEVPQDYVREGIIILNISPQAIEDLTLGEAAVSFEGRFGGMPSRVYVPIGAIISIYAKENGKGMVLRWRMRSHRRLIRLQHPLKHLQGRLSLT